MHIREYILESNFKLTYIDNKLDIVNYNEIVHFDSNKIIINYNTSSICITGDNLYVSRLLKDEVLIEGNIQKVEFR